MKKLFIVVIIILVNVSGLVAEEFLLFAASSLTDLSRELAVEFQKETGIKVETSLASSSTLAKQIEMGAPADLFISANPQWADYLEKKGIIEGDRKVELFSNKLVLICNDLRSIEVVLNKGGGVPKELSGLLVIADPEHVPAGIYAKEALENLGWWDSLKRNIVACCNVRDALMMVERGETDFGIVYETDISIALHVRKLAVFPESTHEKIVYVAVPIDKDVKITSRFVKFLKGEVANKLYKKYGFIPLSSHKRD